jgi:hypothetical protein
MRSPIFALILSLLLAPSASAETTGAGLDRVPAQKVGEPFATITLGYESSALLPMSSRWDLPVPGGGFGSTHPVVLSESALHIGGLHFFGHLELFVTIPIYAPKAGVDSGRALSVAYGVATGLRWYPWRLGEGDIAPFLSSGLMGRRLSIADTSDPGANASEQFRFVVPAGIGASWRTPWHFIIDGMAEYRFGDHAQLGSGVVAQPLDSPSAPYESRSFDLRGVRFSLGIKADFDATSYITAPGFREGVARRLVWMQKNGTASTYYVALGPSSRLVANRSDYFDSARPYLWPGYQEGLFPHAAVGMYLFGPDLDLRVAFRAFGGGSRAFGAELQSSQIGVFAEALKLFDVHLYGFVPFVGVGAGYLKLSTTDMAHGEATHAEGSRIALSVPFGWDIRIDPSTWWLLRTNLRWIPTAKLGVGTRHLDFGGLEYDFIQLVVYPDRIISPAPDAEGEG